MKVRREQDVKSYYNMRLAFGTAMKGMITPVLTKQSF